MVYKMKRKEMLLTAALPRDSHYLPVRIRGILSHLGCNCVEL